MSYERKELAVVMAVIFAIAALSGCEQSNEPKVIKVGGGQVTIDYDEVCINGIIYYSSRGLAGGSRGIIGGAKVVEDKGLYVNVSC